MEFEHLKGKLPLEAKKAMRWQSIFTHSLWLLATAGYFLLVHFLIGGQLLDGYQLDY